MNLPPYKTHPARVDCQALQLQSQADNLNPDDTVRLRALCENIDQLVEPVVAAILAAGLTPIVIGGGHNNCYPLLSASSKHFGCAINALNLDPHGDFRALEGRHSGNGFHYAARRGYLQGYHVIALDEQKNNQDILAALHEHHASYTSYHALKVATTTSIAESVNSALHSFTLNSPLAIELDVDAITCAPASAFNHRGVSLSEAEQYVFCAARTSALAYIHLCEAAPEQDPNGYDAGECRWQILTALVIALRARYQRQLKDAGDATVAHPNNPSNGKGKNEPARLAH